MKMISTPSSSSIHSFGWGMTGEKEHPVALAIVFHTGRKYHYYGVPLALCNKLESAHRNEESVGRFFNEHIKGNYKFSFIGVEKVK